MFVQNGDHYVEPFDALNWQVMNKKQKKYLIYTLFHFIYLYGDSWLFP